jgi:hypothetical protein
VKKLILNHINDKENINQFSAWYNLIYLK